ncbi:hypothetical protein KY329_02190 [Candidatus Woesearchaeota archaeon]|nr:hypothetical protein [Candidatus Woesearchaeota archaeon]
MGEESLIRIVLAVIVGVLFGIVYSMRVLVLMERRVARIERHIEIMAAKTLRSERTILTAMSRKKAATRKKKTKKRRR